jgi:hypothetical protein
MDSGNTINTLGGVVDDVNTLFDDTTATVSQVTSTNALKAKSNNTIIILVVVAVAYFAFLR